jgi:hypothetical protein
MRNLQSALTREFVRVSTSIVKQDRAIQLRTIRRPTAQARTMDQRSISRDNKNLQEQSKKLAKRLAGMSLND